MRRNHRQGPCVGVFTPAVWQRLAVQATAVALFALAGATGAEASRAPSVRPKVLTPLMAKAPVIDGVLAEGEWNTLHLARWVGGKGDYLSEREGEFWVGSDGVKLYIAARSAVHPTRGAVTKMPPRKGDEDAEGITDDDAIELWVSQLAFGGAGQFQIILNSAGAVWDGRLQYDSDYASKRPRLPHEGEIPREHVEHANKLMRPEWTAALEQAHRVADGFWVAEVAIDLKSLLIDDLSVPVSLRVCRNYQSPKEQARWAPKVSFFSTELSMPIVCFDNQAPIVSETGFQDEQGIRMGVDVTNPGKEALSVKVTLSCLIDKEKEPTLLEEGIDLASGETRRIELVRPLTDAQREKGVAAGEIRVRPVRGGTYYHRDVRWRLRPAGPLWEE